ncbi:hypothetical protein BDDG_11679, partial [Blastomyces dermatitidis ATCC 18188]
IIIIITLCFHNKCYCSAHTEQFVSKSSCVDRSAFINDSELNVELLIENLKNMIMKKLSVLYVTESSVSLSVSSVSFSAAFSQSSTPVSVSDSPASAISVPVTLTSATSALSGFAVSAFIISSPCFKKMLYRLDELCFLAKDIHVFRNRNMNIILFYICRHEAYTSYLRSSEIILIEDDNTTETTLSYSQASFVTFSLFSVRKIVYTLSCKYSVLSDSYCHLSDSVSSSSSVSSVFIFSILTLSSAGSALFFNFSTH